MPLYRFRVYWEEDDLTYRDIEVTALQTLMDFNTAITRAWSLTVSMRLLFLKAMTAGSAAASFLQR